MKTITTLIYWTLLLFFAITASALYSQTPGTFNTTYGNGGIFSRPVRYSDFVTEDVALQDNFLLISGRLNAGYFNENIVVRYNDNGTIDRNFAENGVLRFPFETTGAGYSTVSTYSNNDVLISNLLYNSQGFYPQFSRYDANGNLITSFGDNGYFNMDYLQDDLRVLTEPTIDPNMGDFEVALSTEEFNANDRTSFLVKVKNDGTIDTDFGNNGQTNIFSGHIASMDRNPFNSNFHQNIFNGAQGDLILGVMHPSSQYYQYIEDAGNFVDNSADDRDAKFVGRFYEKVFTQLNTNIMLFDGQNIRTFPLDDPNNLFTFNSIYETADASHKPGFKKLNNNEYLLFGGNIYSNFLISKTTNEGFGLDTNFGNNGIVAIEVSPNNEPYDDKLIDCFQKPNGKLICAGSSELPNADGNDTYSLSMVQLMDDGNFDTGFGSNGIELFDNSFTTENGQLLTTPIDNPFLQYKPWVGTISEPFTQRKYVEVVNPLFNHNNGVSDGELTTDFTELEFYFFGKYIDLTQTLPSEDEVILGVGYVNNENDNNFAMVRFKEYLGGFENHFFGNVSTEILQTDINNGSDDKATSFVIQNDNGIQKILVVGETDGKLAMVRYFADGADAGVLDTSFGNGGIIFIPRPLATTASFVPNKSINGDNNQFYICGEETEGTTKRFILKKYQANGEADQTFLAYDEIENANENKATDVLKTSDGGFIVIGKTFSNGEHILKIRKYDVSGNAVPSFGNNSYIFLNTNDEISELTDLIELTNGGIAVVGYSEDELLVMVFNGNTGAMDLPFANNGILRGTFGYDSIHLTSVSQEDATNILISGTSELDGKKNVFNAKVYISEFLGVENNTYHDQIILFPNPTSSNIQIKLPLNISLNKISVYDQTGKLIKIQSENLEFVDVENVASGMYFAEISTSEGITTKKIIVQK
jgi:uncharacterized delta-60 repeat protein